MSTNEPTEGGGGGEGSVGGADGDGGVDQRRLRCLRLLAW